MTDSFVYNSDAFLKRRKSGYVLSFALIWFVIAVSQPLYAAPQFTGPERHPFIVTSSIDDIKSRIIRDPYKKWFADEVSQARTIVSLGIDWSANDTPPETRASYAKTLAFAWAVADSTYAGRSDWAREATLSLLSVPSGSYSSRFSSDLEVAEAALFWAEAYDCLKAGGYDFSLEGMTDVEASIRDRFRGLRDYMARDTFLLFPSSPSIGTDFSSVAYLSDTSMDNHHVKLNAALVVLALVIYDDSGSASDYTHGYDRLTAALRTMTVTGSDGSPAGGWAEGASYFQYSAQQYLGAVQALKNLDIADLYTEIPELAETHLQLPLTALPDGYMAPTDDGESFVFDLAGLLYSHHANDVRRDLLLWLWDKTGRPLNSSFRADHIALFDDTPPVYDSPEAMNMNPVCFRPESGFARLGDSWNADAISLFLQSEHGEAHTNGQAHEHPDQNSFILNAFGEMLILDSGYGGWNDHDTTRYAVNHNLVLVDGVGPPEARKPLIGAWTIGEYGASITDSLSSQSLDSVVSETVFQNTNTSFERRIVFPSRRFFFIHDTLVSGQDVAYKLLFHGNGGGTSGGSFTSTGAGGEWRYGDAVLSAYITGSTGAPEFSTEDMHHSYYGERPLKTHTVLKASQHGAEAQYLTLMYPCRADEAIPEMTAAAVTGGSGIRLMYADGSEATGAFKKGGQAFTVHSGTSDFESDGDFVYAAMGADGTIEHLYWADGTYISGGLSYTVTASKSTTVSLDYSVPHRIAGVAAGHGEIALAFAETAALKVTSGGLPVTFTQDNGTLLFSVDAPAAFEIELKDSIVTLDPPFDVTAEDVAGDNGHAIRLVWYPSPSEKDGLVGYYRLFRSRSPEFSDPVSLDSFASVDDADAWEEFHAVIIDSVDVGVNDYIDRTVFRNGVTYYYWIQAVGNGGVSEKAPASMPLSVEGIPAPFILDAPFPNPFNEAVTIRYFLGHDTMMSLGVYDILGRKVIDLDADGKHPGWHAAVWNGRDENGSMSAGGVYIIRLKTGKTSFERRILFLK